MIFNLEICSTSLTRNFLWLLNDNIHTTPLLCGRSSIQNRYERLQVSWAMKYRYSVATGVYEHCNTFMVYCTQLLQRSLVIRNGRPNNWDCLTAVWKQGGNVTYVRLVSLFQWLNGRHSWCLIGVCWAGKGVIAFGVLVDARFLVRKFRNSVK
jgi:hypothetical protein